MEGVGGMVKGGGVGGMRWRCGRDEVKGVGGMR